MASNPLQQQENIWQRGLAYCCRPVERLFAWLEQHTPAEITLRNVLLFCMICLLCLGTVMVGSASMSASAVNFDNPYAFVWKQVFSIMMGIFIFFFAYHFPLKFGFKYSLIWLILSAVLLVLVLAVGREVNGSVRWISLGFINFQPSELAKVATALYMADFVTRRNIEIREHLLVSLLRLILPVGLTISFVLIEPDLGATIVIIMTALAILCLAGIDMKSVSLAFVALFLFVALFIVSSSWRRERFWTIFHPWEDPLGAGYQLTQSFMAFGNGGWTGVGLGQSIHKMSYLPEAHTDFMLAITSEELGFIGFVLILGLSFTMVICCYRIAIRALRAQYMRCGYLACGIATIFLLQIMVNTSMNMGLIPTKGLTFPFLSYGGSSLIVCAMMMGMMLQIDKMVREKTEPKDNL